VDISKFVRSLNHPHIIRFFGIYTDIKGTDYMVSEFASHGGLDRLIKDNKTKYKTEDYVMMYIIH
jgi:serine/threonine protein kinase